MEKKTKRAALYADIVDKRVSAYARYLLKLRNPGQTMKEMSFEFGVERGAVSSVLIGHKMSRPVRKYIAQKCGFASWQEFEAHAVKEIERVEGAKT